MLDTKCILARVEQLMRLGDTAVRYWLLSISCLVLAARVRQLNTACSTPLA